MTADRLAAASRQRARYAALTPEGKAEYSRRGHAQQAARRGRTPRRPLMSDERKAAKKAADRAWRASQSPEQKATRNARHNELRTARGIRARTPEEKVVRAEYLRLKKFGLTRADYEALLTVQAGLCAVCDTPMDPPYVDHCHATGEVRALLCCFCNMGIGQLGDSAERCHRAGAYLDRWLATTTAV